MKKTMTALFVIMLLTTIGVLSACKSGGGAPETPKGGETSGENHGKEEPVLFESFVVSEQGMSSESYGFSGQRTEQGAHLEYFVSASRWNEEKEEYVEERVVVRAIEGDETFYQELCRLFGECRIDTWAGFHGENPPGVLDGTSMNFEGVLADGTRINAYGSNNFPKNYRTFYNALFDRTTKEVLGSTVFENRGYRVTLPESWVGVVTVSYDLEYVAFRAPKKDGEDGLTFLIIDDEAYGYYNDKNALTIGRLQEEETGDLRYIVIRGNYDLKAYKEQLREDALFLVEEYEEAPELATETFTALPGYVFLPEDGTILYEADARNLFTAARGMWLKVFLTGEYPAGVTTREFNGKTYGAIYNSSPDWVRSMDDLREKLYTAFEKTFADKLVDGAIKKGDLLEEDNAVYALMKKAETGDQVGSFYVSGVEDCGDGSYNVVVPLRVKQPGDDTYEYSGNETLRFHAVPDGKGGFVFDEFPIWER